MHSVSSAFAKRTKSDPIQINMPKCGVVVAENVATEYCLDNDLIVGDSLNVVSGNHSTPHI